jgi:outer membrane protein OmpA-like peptidoglycan-associated protein
MTLIKPMTMKILYTVLFVLCFGQWAWSQNTDTKANRYYENLAYAQYIQLKGGSSWTSYDQETLRKLGESYRKTADFKNAERAYQALLNFEGVDPIYRLYYAQALQSNGFYGKAAEQYYYAKEQMQAAQDERAEEGFEACNQVNSFRAKGIVNMYNVEALNSPDLDFSPTFYDDGIVFVSTRGDASMNQKDLWIDDNCMDLYFAPIKEGQVLAPRPFSDELNGKFHEGPVTFTDDEQTIFFSRNNYVRGKRKSSKDRITKLKIYTAEQQKGRWKNITELPFNSDEYDVCHPALSADERVLVFSSSKGEGHQGGMDLYGSFWVGDYWTTPVNLGSEINTAGNEVFPYLYSDGSLYFSSTGHGGLGGLDLFVALFTGNDAQPRWQFPLNIGAPFNSPHDDFGLILNQEETAGYLSSNRLGGKGEDDIYQFTIQATSSLESVKPRPKFPLQICVYDKKTNERLENARVGIRPTNGNNFSAQRRQELGLQPGQNLILSLSPVRGTENEYTIQVHSANEGERDQAGNKIIGQTNTTNDEGVFPYQMYARETYLLEVEKEGYVTVQEYFTMPAEADLEEFCVGISKRGDLLASQLNIIDRSSRPNGSDNNSSGTSNPAENPDNPNQGTAFPMEPSQLLGPDGRPLPSGQPYVAGVVLNKEYNRPLPRSTVTLLNRCTGEDQVYTINETGRFAFALECGCDYVLKARKDRFIGANKVLSLIRPEDCAPVVTELLLTPGFDRLGEPINIAGRTITETLKEGDVLELRNIFYDFDKYYIREEASADLDRLAALMQQFPSMQIELSSHTDSRGTDSYNNTLSTNRAKSAREYLMKKGIAGDRIRAVGYGEQRLRNPCADGVNCSEYEHQRNRRTEVLLTKFDQAEYIKVYYEKNEPVVVDPKEK